MNEIDEVLKGKPESLIIHIGTHDLTNNINLLTNVKKIVNKVKKTSPDTVISFSDIVFRKDKKKNIEKTRADTKSRLRNFYKQKNIKLILNDHLKEEHLGIKKLHWSRKGNTVFAKNLLNFIEGNSFLNPSGDTCNEVENVSNPQLRFQMLKRLLEMFV